MKKIAPALLSAALLAPVAAVAQSEKPARQDSTSVVSDLQRRIESLERRVNALNSRVTYRFAVLDCNSGKYDEFLMTTSVLPLFASCTKIEPYLEGHRIILSIGNPHSFHFNQVKGSLNYGKDVADSFGRHAEVLPTDGIRAGSWTTVIILVNPSRPEEMRYLSLEIGAQMAVPTR